MKKLWALVLVGAMLFLVGCNSGLESSAPAVEADAAPAADAADTDAVPDAEGETEEGKIYVGVSIGSLESEYWASLAKGAELFVDSLPEGAAEVVVLTSPEPDEQVAVVESFITTYGTDGVLFIDPRNVAVTVTIAEMCEAAGVNFVLYSGLAEDLYPTDYENFVAFVTQDDSNSGYLSACALFESIGGSGKVAELYGILGTDPSFLRNEGLMRALEEYPDIELVDSQVGGHVASEALAITENWIALYGDELDAIYCHSDTMAVAAAEALKQAGMAGEVHVAGFDGTAAAFDCIKEGSMYNTIFNDGYLVGGYGAAYAYAARVGTIDTATMDQATRMFYSKVILVTGDNVDDMVANYVESTPVYDYTDLDYAIDALMDNPSL